MFDLDRWEEIWQTISRNRKRSIMTAFGVFWGIFMLTIMLGAGLGLKNALFSQLGDMSVNSCFFWGGRTSIPYKGLPSGRYWQFENEDLAAIQKPGAQRPQRRLGHLGQRIQIQPERQKRRLQPGRIQSRFSADQPAADPVRPVFQRNRHGAAAQGMHPHRAGLAGSVSRRRGPGRQHDPHEQHVPDRDRHDQSPRPRVPVPRRQIGIDARFDDATNVQHGAQATLGGGRRKRRCRHQRGGNEYQTTGLRTTHHIAGRYESGLLAEPRRTGQQVQLAVRRNRHADLDRRDRHAAGRTGRGQQHHAGHRPRTNAGDRRPPGPGSAAPDHHLADHERKFRADVRRRNFRIGACGRTAVGRRIGTHGRSARRSRSAPVCSR